MGVTLAPALASTGHAQSVTLVVKWAWTSSSVEPTALNVMTTPSVIDLNGDGTPDLVFGTTSLTGGGPVQSGFLRALNGSDGSELFTVTDSTLLINAASSVATGDIDGDASPDIIACDESDSHLIAFNHDGSFKWRSPVLETIDSGAPTIADLNQDGVPEIVIGRQVLDNAGKLFWTGTGERANQGGGSLSVVANLDLDGSLEVVAGSTIYGANGAIKRRLKGGPDGVNAVADFDGDGQAEIVLVSAGTVRLYEHDLSLRWGPVSIPGGGAGGPPTIADYDGDGLLEIGAAGSHSFAVFETDGSLKWEAATQDVSSARTGSAAFDVDGDGATDVVYRDELKLWVFRGTDGSVLFETPLSSCTWSERPLVADVDGDGHAEIVTVANNNCAYGTQRGVYVFAAQPSRSGRETLSH